MTLWARVRHYLDTGSWHLLPDQIEPQWWQRAPEKPPSEPNEYVLWENATQRLMLKKKSDDEFSVIVGQFIDIPEQPWISRAEMQEICRKIEFIVGSDWRLSKLQVEPGDIITVSTDLMLNSEQVQDLSDRVKAYAPNHQVLILTAGLKLGVLQYARPHGRDEQ